MLAGYAAAAVALLRRAAGTSVSERYVVLTHFALTFTNKKIGAYV